MKYIGIDIGGTNLKAGLVDETGQLLATRKMKVAGIADPAALAWTIHALSVDLCKDFGCELTDIFSIGVGCPGAVEIRGGSILYTCNLPLRNVPLRRLFHQLSDLPLYIENDANCAALAEYYVGGGRGSKRFITVTLGTGVGGGVIVNNHVIDGTHGAGGEIGHITVNRHETAVCGCGKHGCLEQYSSATGVVRCMKKLLDENPDTPCTLRGTDFAAKDVFDAARSGDALAAREVDEMTDTLGMALATIAATVDPEMFMVGGGVSRAGEVLFAPLREHYKVYAFKSCRETPIVPAILGNDAGIYGSVRLIVGE